MASQRITIAKIGGASAAAVISQFRDWSAARNVDDPTEWRYDQWPTSVRRDIDAFASALRSNGHEPPVIYFSEHIDLWSMGDVFDRWLSPDDGDQPIQLHADRFQLWCYPLPDDESLASHLQRSTRLKRIRERNPQEDRWFTMNLLEATLAWDGMVDPTAIIVLREVLGGLVMDSELEESLNDVPPWIAKRSANAT
jgi:hypothetical protein